MKRLIPLFAGLCLASCDSGTKQVEGTSSETQTSLRELATRLDGLNAEAPTVGAVSFAARSGASTEDSSAWDDLWREWTTASYNKRLGGQRVFRLDSTINTSTSASSFAKVRTIVTSSGSMRSIARWWSESRSCADSLLPPPYCLEVITSQRYWMRTAFRNGVIVTPIDSVLMADDGYILDERWTIRLNNDVVDADNIWWSVFEDGRRIGLGRQQGRAHGGIDDNSFLTTLSTMTIFDMEGHVVPPDLSTPHERVAFPEDSLGLSIDSAEVDSLRGILHLHLSWRFQPGAGFPTVDSVDASVSVGGSTRSEGEVWSDSYRVGIQVRTAVGRQELVVPLDSIHVANPSSIIVQFSAQTDTLVGSRAQTRRELHADIEAAYPRPRP